MQKWKKIRPEDENSSIETSEPLRIYSLCTHVHGTMSGSVSSSATSDTEERGSGDGESLSQASEIGMQPVVQRGVSL